VRHSQGNWLIDSPKFLSPLVRRLESLGGVAHIFLTHSDDVADAQRYAQHFDARRIIHRRELAAQPGAEMVLDGDSPAELTPGFLAVPTPGHTEGHCCLLVQERFLFTGDHLAWDRDERRLIAFRDYCWHSWSQQRASMARLLENSFEWVLPGHGQRVHLPAADKHRQLRDLVERM
jgi:glyoxylase-like metal-dependent hydrolase (beta-lactamase superfamily II)